MSNMTKQQRSFIMQTIKSKDTKIEVLLRKALWRQGIRYRKNYKICNCKPDIVITKHKLAIFCDGDFWHGKNSKYQFHTNKEYWNEKIKRNKERDLENTIQLRDEGWIVLRFWESEIKENLDDCLTIIRENISKKQP